MRVQRVLILGPIAPPVGGVSIHISRITQLLNKEFEFDFIDESREIKPSYFNIRSLNFFLYLKKLIQANILFIHSGKKSLRTIHLLIGKILGKKVILTIHSFRSDTPIFVSSINGFFYRLANSIVVVNPEIKNQLHLPEKKTIVKDAFIPPQIECEPELPKEIQESLSKNNNDGNLIICANASRLDKYNNQDLYGLDMCIEVAKRLVEKKLPFFFIFVVSSLEKNADTFFKSKELIKKLGLSEKFILTNESLSFVKLIEKADIIVRPTNTDGDSLTIREALFFNKPILASDIVERPAGVNLFQTRNFDDLEKELETLIKRQIIKKGLEVDNTSKSKEEFKKFYSALLNLKLS